MDCCYYQTLILEHPFHLASQQMIYVFVFHHSLFFLISQDYTGCSYSNEDVFSPLASSPSYPPFSLALWQYLVRFDSLKCPYNSPPATNESRTRAPNVTSSASKTPGGSVTTRKLMFVQMDETDKVINACHFFTRLCTVRFTVQK